MKRTVLKLSPRIVSRFFWLSVSVMIGLYVTGAYLYFFEQDYFTLFRYPVNVDLREIVSELRLGHRPAVSPVIPFEFNIRFNSSHKCRNQLTGSFEPVRLLILIKSATDHFENRRAIRLTWGWENRFSDVTIRRVFLLGLPKPDDDSNLQSRIEDEQAKHMDLVQAKFVDSYYNNTLKTILGLNWIKMQCPTAEFVFMVDDDYYVSTKNVLRFMRHTSRYPEYLKRALLSVDHNVPNRQSLDHQKELDKDEAPVSESVGDMFVGYRFFSKPIRIRFSKWFISLEEYPFSRFPPYITAGAYLISQQTAETFYYASLYTVPFRFDDIYIGILAKKTGIEPIHNEYFYYARPTHSSDDFTYAIASHGFADPEELVSMWNEQRGLGNA